MALTPLLIRTIIYLIKMVSAIRGKGMVDSEAGELMRAWERELKENP
jgi:hypothetical protein